MIAKLSGKSAENYYYEKDPIMNSDGGNENLSWQGQGATLLGLEGNVDREDFKQVLDGKLEDTELRSMSSKTSGEDRKAFDMTFSAPKSVSHLALVMDKDEVVNAHQKAVEDTMKYVEKNFAQTRTYNEDGNRVKENTGNLLVAKAEHSISRATANSVSDPSLHTHNVIANTTQAKDGSWKSLSTDELFKNQHNINKMYKENLAHNLKEEGYALNFDKKGNFEIAGYTKDVIDNFSKRKFEIAGQAEQLKENPKFADKTDKELRDIAQHEFKQEKVNISKDDLKSSWNQQHKEAGLTSKEELLSSINAEKDYASTKEKLSVKEVVSIAAETLADKESHFSKENILKTALKVNEGDNSPKDIEKFIDDTKKIGQKEPNDLKKITVQDENGKDKVAFTTKEVFEIEKENVKLVKEFSENKGTALLTEEQANKSLDKFEDEKGWKMTDTQREFAFTTLTTENTLLSVQGDAGTGKTTALEAVRVALEDNNYSKEEIGVLAPTGKASLGAEKESGIEAMTVDSYLNKGFRKTEDYNVSENSAIKENGDIKKESEYSKADSNAKDLSKFEKEVLEDMTKNDKTKDSNVYEDKKDRFSVGKIEVGFTDKHREAVSKLKSEQHGFKSLGLKASTQDVGGVFMTEKIKRSSIESTKFDRKTGDSVIKNTSKKLGVELETRKSRDGAITTKKETLKDLKSGATKETTIKTSNVFGKTNKVLDKSLMGFKQKDEKGNLKFKDSFSKKLSDKVYKDDTRETVIKNSKEGMKFKEEDKSLLGGLASSKTDLKSFNKDNVRIDKSKSENSFLGGMISLNKETTTKTQEGKLFDTKQEEKGSRTISLFGKEVSSKNIDYSRERDSKVVKAKEFIKEKVDNYFNKDKELEASVITKQEKNGKGQESLSKTEISKIDDKKSLVSNTTYLKDKNEDKFKEVNSKSQIIKKSVENIKDKAQEKASEPTGKKLVFVDEASMLSSKKMNALLKDAKENGHKLVPIGDTKQLLAVQQGKAFNEFQESTKNVHMNQGMRQKTEEAKIVVDTFAKGEVKDAMSTLDKQERLLEVKDSSSRSEFIADKLSDNSAYKDTVALASTRSEVKEINDLTREKLHGSKDFGEKFNVREDKRLDDVDKMSSTNFQKGDIIGVKVETPNGKTRFSEYEVKAVNNERNEITLASDKKEFKMDLRQDSKNITTVSKIEERSFTEGDKVMTLKNNTKNNTMNGEIGFVENIDSKNQKMTINFGDNKKVEFDMSKEKEAIDHAYGMTVHKSQGVTEQNAIVSLNTENASMNNKNLAYVAVSRHKTDLIVLTDDKDKLVEQIDKEQIKASTADSSEHKEALKEEMFSKTETKDSSFENKLEDKIKDESKDERFESKNASFDKNDFKEVETFDKSEYKEIDLKEDKEVKVEKDEVPVDSKESKKEETKESQNEEKKEDKVISF